MAHLGVDVAAFVDGQLSGASMQGASQHLELCEECRGAVRHQRLLKSRMSTVATPDPPPALLASLAGLATSAVPPQVSWWDRVRRAAPVHAGLVFMGASVAVIFAAYAVGNPDDTVGDDVSPPFGIYAASFSGPAVAQASNIISDSAMDELDGSGWPCRSTLAGDMQRTSGSYAEADDVVALTYTNGTATLKLFERNGALDRDSLDGFTQTRMGGSQVWVRRGIPTLVAWDDDGVVYTIVTDADRHRIVRAVTELPRGSVDQGPVNRIGDGLARMSSWVDAA